MTKSIQIRADESLVNILEKIRREVAENYKKEFGLNEVTINGTIASQIAAARLNGIDILHFKIRKIGLNRGVLELF
jgi:hypothetical protein